MVGVASGAIPLLVLPIGVLFAWSLLVGLALAAGAIVGSRYPSGLDVSDADWGSLRRPVRPGPEADPPAGVVDADFELVPHDASPGPTETAPEPSSLGGQALVPSSLQPTPEPTTDWYTLIGSGLRLVKTRVEAAAGQPIAALDLPRSYARAVGPWRGDCYLADPGEETVLVAADLVVFSVAADRCASVQQSLVAEGPSLA